MAASRAFSHGGSAEELLLPFLAAALFSLVRALHSPGAKPLRAVCVQGLLAGCALWLKYTVLGFYLAWVVVLAALYLRRGWLTQLGRSVGAYLGGMALATMSASCRVVSIGAFSLASTILPAICHANGSSP